MRTMLGSRCRRAYVLRRMPGLSGGASPKFPFRAFHQFGRFQTQSVGEDEHSTQRGRVLPAFEQADVGRVQLARGAETLLGEPLGLPGVAKHAPERFVQPLGSACRSLGHGPDCCGRPRRYSTEYVLSFGTSGTPWRGGIGRGR